MDEKEIEMIAEDELEKAKKADGEAEAEKAVYPEGHPPFL